MKLDGPPIGSVVEDRTGNVGARFTVLDVFPTNGPGGMILGWTGYCPDLDADGPRAQGFTLCDWRRRWKVVQAPPTRRGLPLGGGEYDQG